eukprot:CAMPEP_0195138846 /NCGR_PEP_ID=MMETSP0448-20130528/158313_1 /TAXON_ID=66468 /ORGANISM="Heterocapsa triquestra, Strain CCMP 448" /LENGTH=48 /DNA_ID= /DNA_START= /DNA_END= /DNA_ORIENTATION=
MTVGFLPRASSTLSWLTPFVQTGLEMGDSRTSAELERLQRCSAKRTIS